MRGNIPEFATMDWGKPSDMSVMIVVVPAEIGTGYFQNTVRKLYHLSQLAHSTVFLLDLQRGMNIRRCEIFLCV
jgi:hypothetical protein